jgi:hypothetical protein
LGALAARVAKFCDQLEHYGAALALGVSGRALKRMAGAGELPDGAVVRVSRRRLFVKRALELWVAAGCPAPIHKR